MKTILVVLALVTVTPTVRAANGVTPGQFVIEPATLICFGFEWDITSDAIAMRPWRSAIASQARRRGADRHEMAHPREAVGNAGALLGHLLEDSGSSVAEDVVVALHVC